MQESTHVENPDVVLIGSGIMSATLGAMIKRLKPELTIQLYEVTEELAQESSNGWNNAGTGHAGICELSYTPNWGADGKVDVSKAIDVFQQFDHSKQFWAYGTRTGMLPNPPEFINQVPHLSFVHGQKQVDFLTSRYEGLKAHHFFETMQFSTDRDEIASWAPLLIEGRDPMPVAATKMDAGTDVNFGAIARKLIHWLSEQEGCGVAVRHRVVDLQRTSDGWHVAIKDLARRKLLQSRAKFVFVGAGGGSLQLLQKSGIAESKGYGGFPVGGQWLVCDNPDIVERHHAKVYGQAQDEAPTMAVPHLDRRIIDGKKSVLFGPFAAWTTKFLHKGGSMTDLPFSMRLDNIAPMLKVGFHNLPLVKYLVQQGTQSMASRLKLLRTFYPEANHEDWRLKDAGIRVQAVKKEDGEAGIVHYGTEVVGDKDKTIAALLGASPGASVSVAVMTDLIKNCLPQLLETNEGKSRMKEMIPTYGEDMIDSAAADRYREVSRASEDALQLA
ncbi:Malate:quinone oxidoreductase [Planctomycetes bacterium Pan216]|uniref:Probable malate:quinone oxidoreductase n=1 Tax=Kolteria novifilia TaxID=2527975 RepID=A0A518B191_9BACT|nr:Malate:quinone oxidoreductase [Planctomycetes bacterium Pan216]